MYVVLLFPRTSQKLTSLHFKTKQKPKEKKAKQKQQQNVAVGNTI
jgi:hypothetical protein